MVKSKLLQSSSALIVDSRLTLAVTTSIKHVNKVTNLLLHFFHILIFNPTFIAAVFISSTNKTAWSITNSLQRCGVSLPSPILELERKDCNYLSRWFRSQCKYLDVSYLDLSHPETWSTSLLGPTCPTAKPSSFGCKIRTEACYNLAASF